MEPIDPCLLQGHAATAKQTCNSRVKRLIIRIPCKGSDNPTGAVYFLLKRGTRLPSEEYDSWAPNIFTIAVLGIVGLGAPSLRPDFRSRRQFIKLSPRFCSSKHARLSSPAKLATVTADTYEQRGLDPPAETGGGYKSRKMMPPVRTPTGRSGTLPMTAPLRERHQHIVAWVKAGAPQGDHADMPAPATFTKDGYPHQGRSCLRIASPFSVPASGMNWIST